MLDIGIGLSFEDNSALAAEEAIKQAKAGLKNNSKIDLGLVFNTSDFSTAGITKTLNSLLNGPPLIGGSAPAIITSLGILKHGIVVLLLCFPEGVYCSTASAQDISEKSHFDSGKELAEKLLFGFKSMPRNLGLMIGKRLTLRGFLVGDHAESRPAFLEEVGGWLAEGRIRLAETVFEGVENAPAAFIGLMRGENIGKMLVRVGD